MDASVPLLPHASPPMIRFSHPLLLSQTLGRGLFWLEFDKAQVVLPAVSSLVLAGCPPALGLFTVLSVAAEEGQEGTVGP